MALIRLDDETKTKIGRLLLQYVDSGLNIQGRMPQWWLDVDRQYRNEKPGEQDTLGSTDDPGYAQFHVPFTQPRLDMLGAQVCTVVGKQRPYMTDTEDDQAISEERQNLLHDVWKDAGFEHKIRMAAKIAGCTDLAYYRVCPSYSQRGVIDIDVLHPDQVIVFPALPQGIQAAACVGHRLYVRRYVVDRMMDDKTYYLTPNIPTASQDENDLDREQEHTGTELGQSSPNPDQELVELWPCIVRLDLTNMKDSNKHGEEKLYRATLDYKSGRLLCLEDYGFTFIWYFRSQYIGSAREYYSTTSVGRNLFGIQDCYNSLWSAFYGGTNQAASGGPIFGPALTGSEKYTRFGMNQYVETDGAVSPWAPNVKFDGASFPQMINKLEEVGDRVARVSQNTQGAQATGQTTATEQSIIAAGVAVGIEEYIAEFTHDFPAMASHTMQLIGDDFNAFEQRYGKPREEGQLDLTPLLGLGSNLQSEIEGMGEVPLSLAGEQRGDTI